MRKSKKAVSLFLCLAMAASALSGCNSSNAPASSDADTQKTSSAQTSKASDSGEINMFINSPEYADAINAAISEYKNVQPNVKINFETTQSDYPTLLKAKINSGEIPDIFASTAGGEIQSYAEYSQDLTNEPLAAALMDSVRANMSYDGKVYGFPIKSNAFGMLYNQALFDKAGIKSAPQTLSELETDCQKLQKAGIKAFSTGYKEWWVFKHVFQHFLNAAKSNDVSGLVSGFIAGKNKFASYPALNDSFFKFIDLSVKYGDDKPLETDLSAEETAFATGKVAMLCGQGAWVEADIKKITPDIKIGFAGYPVSENPQDCKIIVGADQALRVNKNSKNLKATLDFCNWWYTSDYGKKWFSTVAKVIPPVKGSPIPDMDIPKAMQEAMNKGKPGDLAISYSLDGFHQKFGEIMQGYIAKTNTKEKAISEIEKQWTLLGAEK